MNNIIKFGKKEPVHLANFEKNLSELVLLIKQNIEIIERGGDDMICMTGPVYFDGNADIEYRKHLNTVRVMALKEILEDLESSVFKDSAGNSDLPQILENYCRFDDHTLPINIPIPMMKATFTLIFIFYGNSWIITDMFCNHRSLNQYAFESLMKHKDTNEENMFLSDEYE